MAVKKQKEVERKKKAEAQQKFKKLANGLTIMQRLDDLDQLVYDLKNEKKRQLRKK